MANPALYARDEAGAQPPALYPDFKSSVTRAPAKPPLKIPQTLTEITGPCGDQVWDRLMGPAVADLTQAELARSSPIRFVGPTSAPALIAHGDADMGVPIVEGERMHAALAGAGVPASFLRIEGAGHGFAGADLERVNAAMVAWFERHLGRAAK